MACHEYDHLLIDIVQDKPLSHIRLKSTGAILGYYVGGPDSLVAFSERIGAAITQQEREHINIRLSGINAINLSMNRTSGPSHKPKEGGE